ncbi:unnamed protein product [Haemonchus placei]|uniref:Endo/exonuclease/phosphatase domain-containing protein n=1 Tax=Haemonchus placei TaxID=6290 RepID=A0A3P7UQ62_HAEPC|nr:unnamed protein product [Haemonchus placei]
MTQPDMAKETIRLLQYVGSPESNNFKFVWVLAKNLDASTAISLREPSNLCSPRLAPAVFQDEGYEFLGEADIDNRTMQYVFQGHVHVVDKTHYNGDHTKRNGVAIAVAESLKDSVSAVSRISSRVTAVRIDTEGYWTITSVYAPQAGCPVYEKDEFYLNPDEAIRSVPEEDYLTIAGDMNGHVGSERRGLERVYGGRGIGVRNEEGERVLDLAMAHDMAVCSTFFAKRSLRR